MKIENGVLIEVTEADLVNGACVVPEGVTEIGTGAFYGCQESLAKIVLPKSVEMIGNAACDILPPPMLTHRGGGFSFE